MSAVIAYHNVEIHQAEQIVLRDVNLEIQPGELVYLLGKVGSGKSSLLKTFYGALEVHSGQAIVLGEDMRQIKRNKLPYLRRRMGIVFQDFQLLTDRNVYDNLRFVLEATGWKDRKAIDEHINDILTQVEMGTKAYKMPYELSGGEQQRIVIARALLNSPELILADEPTGNLDLETGRDILNLLQSISQAGIAVIISTHNPAWPVQFPGRNIHFENEYIHESTHS